jgi:hypothetical protein
VSGVPFRDHFLYAIAHHLLEIRFSWRNAQSAKHVGFRHAPQRLTIDEQAIHIEYYCFYHLKI